MTPLHYDSRDNLICQYIGSKHLTLYPPSQIPWLYTSGFAPSWSAVADPRDPDIKKFPLFNRAKSLEVTLTAGELLYLPARWSHFVRNLETSLMVNFWPQYTTAQEMKIGLGQRVARAKRLVRRALP
jgi:ribosomal protein L16 Arg81 hydroxylase